VIPHVISHPDNQRLGVFYLVLESMIELWIKGQSRKIPNDQSAADPGRISLALIDL